MLESEIKNLINEAKAGNSESFSRVYEEYLTPIYRFIYFRVSNKTEAEDLTQEVFLKVFKSLDRFKTTDNSPLAYFYTVARNLLIDYYRKKKIPTLDVDTIAETLAMNGTPESEAIGNENIIKLKQALNKISENEKEVLILKFIDNYTNTEIAQILQKSEEAVRQLKSRGLKSLREFIKKEDFNL